MTDNRAPLTVVKIGGAELGDACWLDRFAAGVLHARPAVIVHGGGHRISTWQRRLGIPVEKVDGIRVTTLETAEVAQMVLCGPVRASIVRALRAQDVDAVGVAGGDGSLRVELIDAERLGRVGRVVDVNRALLLRLLDAGFTPVLAPSSVGPDGLAVNVNADEAAAAVARELDAAELLFISDVPGVMRDGQPLPVLAAADLPQLIGSGVVRDGMVAKLKAAAQAGRARARIGDLSLLTDPRGGTVVAGGLEVAA